MSVKDEMDQQAKEGPALLVGGTSLLLFFAIIGIVFALNLAGIKVPA